MRVSFTGMHVFMYDYASSITMRACLPKWMVSRMAEMRGHAGIMDVSVLDTYMFPMSECSALTSYCMAFDTEMDGNGVLTYRSINGLKHIRKSYTAYELQKEAIDKNKGLFNIDFGYLHRLYQPFEGYLDQSIWAMQCQTITIGIDPTDEPLMEDVARLVHEVSGWVPLMSTYEINGERTDTPLNRAMNKVFFT